jgi:hypothetical protein
MYSEVGVPGQTACVEQEEEKEDGSVASNCQQSIADVTARTMTLSSLLIPRQRPEALDASLRV